jgi:type I restriction enzyme, S subunit
MIEWPTKTLEEVCAEGGGFVRTGPFGSQLHKSDYVDSVDGIPVVMPKNMSGGAVNLDGIARIDADIAERLSQHLFAPGDVALSRRGDVGRSAFINDQDLPALCGTGCLRIHLGRPKSVKPEFLRYFFRSHLATNYLKGHAVGATMPNLNATIVNAMPVPIPPPAAQRAVGQILSTLDDLIANNRRRVEVLEEMARATFQQWFVHLRFPGHEDATFVETDLGKIPENWETSTIGAIAHVDKGLSYKGAFLTPEGVPMANLKCIAPNGAFRRDGTKPYSGAYKPQHEIRPGELVIANTDLTQAGYVIGAPAVVPNRGFEFGGIMSHHLSAVRPRFEGGVRWLYRSLQDSRFRNFARSVASGATVLGFRPDDTRAYPLTVPPAYLLNAFHAIDGPIATLQERLLDAAETLARLRDMLLPRLVTGELDVSTVDLDAFAESAGV